MGVQAKYPILLLTRPHQAGLVFARMFHARFGLRYRVILSPQLRIEPLKTKLPDADALIFTSQNAVTAYAKAASAQGRVAYCVGERTGQAAHAAGFTPVVGSGGAAELLPIILERHGRGTLLHARGEEVAFDLADALNSAGIETKQAILYRQTPLALSAESKAALMGDVPVLLPLFSPKAARVFFAEAPHPLAPLYIAAMSEQVGQACLLHAKDRLEIASHKQADGMLEALAVLLRAQMAG